MENESDAIKYFIDSTGQRWLVWGGRSQEEMAEWVEEIKKQTRQAELKGKLLIIGGVAATIVAGYSTYVISKKIKTWNRNRRKAGEMEKERAQELRLERLKNRKNQVEILAERVVIVSPVLNGYEIPV